MWEEDVLEEKYFMATNSSQQAKPSATKTKQVQKM